MADSPIVLEMKGISKKFSGVQALKNVSLELRRGEVHALIGENGAGKSTSMKILSGAYPKDSGTIFLKGRCVEIRSPQDALHHKISIIHQELNLVPALSIAENIFLGRLRSFSRWGILDWTHLWREARQILEPLKLALDPRTPVSQLGIAHRQMVEIAKALSFRSEILILDEPTATLSEKEVQTLFQIIRELKKHGVSMFYISHRLEELALIADRVTVLRDGGKIKTIPFRFTTPQKLIQMMVGRKMTQRFPRSENNPTKIPLLQVYHLSRKGYFRDVSFELYAGEILGIAGLVGSGRTSLVRALFGLDSVNGGSIKGTRKEMGFLPEDRRKQGLFLNLSIQENITSALLPRGRLTRWGCLNRPQARRLGRRFIQDLHIRPPKPGQKTRDLSGGNQQKVVLAKWLVLNPKVLIFDEPTRGIDVGAKFEIYQWMRRLAKDGAGIIMVSSDLPEILGMSDRILVMRRGRLAGEVSRKNATQEKVMKLGFLPA